MDEALVLRQYIIKYGREYALLAIKMRVQRCLADAHRFGDVIHAGPLVALVGEQRQCVVQNELLGHVVITSIQWRVVNYLPFGR